MTEPWYKKVITEYRQEIIKAAITALIGALAYSLVRYMSGGVFEVQEINLSTPTLTLRLLSGLVFDSLGYILYELKFYYALYMVMVVALRMKKADYDAAKKLIWYSLMFVMGFYIVPWFMDVLSFVLTVVFNVVMFVGYLAPPIGVFVVIFLPTFYLLKKRTETSVPVPVPIAAEAADERLS
jgi:hypothetical protein